MSISRRSFLGGLLGLAATAVIQPWNLFSVQRPTGTVYAPYIPLQAFWIQICEDCDGHPGKILQWAQPNKPFLSNIWLEAGQPYWLVIPDHEGKLGQQFTLATAGNVNKINMTYYDPATGWHGPHV